VGNRQLREDAALDWAWDLRQSTGLSMVEKAVWDVLDCDDYLEADLGCIGLAAAETVAALNDSPGDGLPEEVSAWVQAQGASPSAELMAASLEAVEKIRAWEGSELKELWEDADDPPSEWHSVLDDLVARLP
jgi:hypothetical protein